MFQPGYIELYRSGELERRARSLDERLACCDLCPRECRVDRTGPITGFCRSGRLAQVSSVCDHHGEEPAISGVRGSGTIFFANCALRCVYCQNHQISQPTGDASGNRLDCRELAERMMYLQDAKGCHNINLVSPTHFVPQIVRALTYAVPLGLNIPLVYNTNAYDSVFVLQQLEGIIDVYLPDLKYASDLWAMKFSQGAGYVEHARQAVKEMYRQVGNLVAGDDGLAQKGLIVRHLVLPNGVAGGRGTLVWMARELSPEVMVSIMSQYFPCHRASKVPMLSRRITKTEYAEVLWVMEDLVMENGWVQELDAPDSYVPDFDRHGHPFEPNRAILGNGVA